MKKRGFTLVEMLIVVTMIGLLMAMITGALMQAGLASKKARAETNMRDLITAWEQYYLYSPNPNISAMQGTWQDMDMQALKPLTDVGADGFVILNLSPSKLTNGEYVDPWKRAYQVRVNTSDQNSGDANKRVLNIRTTVHFKNRRRE